MWIGLRIRPWLMFLNSNGRISHILLIPSFSRLCLVHRFPGSRSCNLYSSWIPVSSACSRSCPSQWRLRATPSGCSTPKPSGSTPALLRWLAASSTSKPQRLRTVLTNLSASWSASHCPGQLGHPTLVLHGYRLQSCDISWWVVISPLLCAHEVTSMFCLPV